MSDRDTTESFLRIGLGTVLGDTDLFVDIVETALKPGCRHVDTAEVYSTEAAVGKALDRADVPRKGVFVTTKTAHIDVPGPGRDAFVESVHESRDALGVDVIDLLYVHWPMGIYDPHVTLSALDDLRDEGVVERIGLSNFSIDLLEEAREILDAPVFAHQVETHPLLQQRDLREYAIRHDIHHIAYSP